jgi:hypothetical protein
VQEERSNDELLNGFNGDDNRETEKEENIDDESLHFISYKFFHLLLFHVKSEDAIRCRDKFLMFIMKGIINRKNNDSSESTQHRDHIAIFFSVFV